VGYIYPHDYPGHFYPQDYLGGDKIYYEPTDQGVERKIKERVERWRAAFQEDRERRRKENAKKQKSEQDSDF
jgi:putative ATPase